MNTQMRMPESQPLRGAEAAGPVCPNPASLDGAAALEGDALRAVAEAACRLLSNFAVGGRGIADSEAMWALEQAVAEVGRVAAAEPIRLTTTQHVEYDAAFSIRRSANTPAALAHSIGTGVLGAVRQLSFSNSMMPGEQQALVSGLARMVIDLAPGTGFRPAFMVGAQPAPLPPYDPVERWVDGHWAFFGICQASIITAHRYADALENGDLARAEAAVRSLTAAMHTLGNGFRLAGDLTEEEYRFVGSQMQPPKLPAGFTGLWLADHQRMLGLVHKIGRMDIPEPLQDLHGAYLAELNFAYWSHRFVCERIAGKRTSLAGAATASAMDGGELVGSYARRAMTRAKAKLS